MFFRFKKFTLPVILLIIVILFYVWSNLLSLSVVLVLIADSFTTRYWVRYLKKKIPAKVYNMAKYAYIIVLPLFFAIFTRTFFFDVYFVPSSSMERTLFPNDYVLVNKVSYGTKVPRSIQDVPVIGSVFKKDGMLMNFNLYKSLKAIKKFKREDIVVFKSTEENDVFLIKRIIGLPSDTLKIVDSKVFVNNILLQEQELYCYNYIDSTRNGVKLIKTFSNKEFENLGASYKDILYKDLKRSSSKRSSLFPYPYAKEQNWTIDNYGELIIPKKGMILILNEDNFNVYKNILLNFEKEDFEISNNEIKAYTFKNNYYFMMGDNRHGSSDSRSFGFVPESYIQGRMIKAFSKERLFN